MESLNKIAIVATCASTRVNAQNLANQLGLPVVDFTCSEYQFLLTVTPERLELREKNLKNSKPIYVDFLAPNLNYRIKHGGGNKQLLAKAIGIKNGIRPMVLDTTAGLGIDAFILATLGCEVVMLERSPIIGALLQDGLARFRKHPQSNNIKLDLHVLSATVYLNKLLPREISKPDTIYLDPMYPARPKAALGKKSMRMLHELVGKDADAAEVFAQALHCAKKRVVVKRPDYASNLGLLKPDVCFSLGGSCRYDVYFTEKFE